MRIIFASNNLHKLSEVKSILGLKYGVFLYSLNDFDIKVDPEENGKSYKENADIKIINWQIFDSEGNPRSNDPCPKRERPKNECHIRQPIHDLIWARLHRRFLVWSQIQNLCR